MPKSTMQPLVLWSSPLRFFLVGFGALAGMDAFSEFPYLLSHYGGATFVGAYTLALLCIGWPLLAAQLSLGRRCRSDGGDGRQALGVMCVLQRGSLWRWTMGAAMLGAFLMFCYVAVISGWMLSYTHAVLAGDFRVANAPFVAAHFAYLVSHPGSTLPWLAMFLLLVFPVVAGGPAAIEELARFLVPGIVALLAGLAAFAATLGSFFVSAPVLLTPQPVPGHLTLVLVALSQAFFGAGFGTASFVAYGASLPSSVSTTKMALGLVLAQALVAWLGGFALASLVFAAGLRPLAGGGFLFGTLALASARLPWGNTVIALCYLALISAAWLSTVAWLEPIMQFLTARGLTRSRAAIGLGLAAFAVGGVLILSLNSWAFSFTFLGRIKALGLLDILMILAVNVLLPWGGGGLSVLMGWGRDGPFGQGEYVARGQKLWLWVLRIVVPTAILIVFFSAPRLIL
ncbi:MAG: sodium-dependent transporter [Acidiferrobacter sp.]